MEELNNVIEETMEIVEPVEVLEGVTETINNISDKDLITSGAAIGILGTAIVVGVVGVGYGIKKLWDNKKSKKTISETTVSFQEEIIYDEELTEEN